MLVFVPELIVSLQFQFTCQKACQSMFQSWQIILWVRQSVRTMWTCMSVTYQQLCQAMSAQINKHFNKCSFNPYSEPGQVAAHVTCGLCFNKLKRMSIYMLQHMKSSCSGFSQKANVNMSECIGIVELWLHGWCDHTMRWGGTLASSFHWWFTICHADWKAPWWTHTANHPGEVPMMPTGRAKNTTLVKVNIEAMM